MKKSSFLVLFLALVLFFIIPNRHANKDPISPPIAMVTHTYKSKINVPVFRFVSNSVTQAQPISWVSDLSPGVNSPPKFITYKNNIVIHLSGISNRGIKNKDPIILDNINSYYRYTGFNIQSSSLVSGGRLLGLPFRQNPKLTLI